jgi:uncharacterized protein YkwD
MVKNKRLIILVLLAGLMVLAACGGGATTSSPDADTSSGAGEPVASGPQLGKVSVDGPAARGATATTSDVAGVCLSPAEAELARLINEYRVSVGLPALPVSKSLTLVAQQHVWDSVNNNPFTEQCNMHSWSGNVNPALQQGTWTAVCYTADHANMAGAHRKPREIAGYPADGYENSHWASPSASPGGAINGWRNSPGHNAVITEQNGWGPFRALGVGISGQYAHMWVGEVTDPAGEAQLCGGGAAPQPTTAAAATAVPPTAVPATAMPLPTTAPVDNAATGEVLNQTGTVAGGGVDHTFQVAPGRRYTVVVTPSAELDAMMAYRCTAGNGSSSGTVDRGWEGEAESFAYIATAAGSCTVTVSGYEGSTGPYTIVVTAR